MHPAECVWVFFFFCVIIEAHSVSSHSSLCCQDCGSLIAPRHHTTQPHSERFKPELTFSTTQLKIKKKRPPADIVILSKWWDGAPLGVCPGCVAGGRAAVVLCCVLQTLSQVLSNRGCAEDGALQPLEEEEGRGRRRCGFMEKRGAPPPPPPC